MRTGEHLENLIGLAFSGGGIRSATFNLGVLQRLQELDLLRGIDYLSTVSGGGYIGSWLLGNVRRTHYWLSQLTDWSESIEHLRRYSNYLAPRSGLMSVDTWTMWASWARNAFLVQLTALVWLWAILTAGPSWPVGVHVESVRNALRLPRESHPRAVGHPADDVVCLSLRSQTVADQAVAGRRALR